MSAINNLQRFLEFNGEQIAVLRADGTWWVAIKPICKALKVNFNRQFKNLKSSQMLGQLLANQPTVGTDGRLREMACLPERYIYGWLLTINSSSTELISFQRECYDILYEHFHGAMTGRMELLAQSIEEDQELADLESKLESTPEFLRIQELRSRKRSRPHKLKKLDKQLIKGQLSMEFGGAASDN